MEKTKLIQKSQKKSNQKSHILRKAAGIVWIDKTMQQWPQNDYRVFCGNLGNQVNDDMLGTVFRSRYASFQKAKVIRDSKTGKSKGYGFVSLKNPKDFLNCLKFMNGQYIGNRPVKIMKSSWKDRDLNSQRNKQLPSTFKLKKEPHEKQ